MFEDKIQIIEEILPDEILLKYSNGFALFDKNKESDDKFIKRYYLYHQIYQCNKDKTITIIMINPSTTTINEETGKIKFDRTLRNVKNFIKENCKEYNSFEILNLFSLIDSNPHNLYKCSIDEINKNLVFLKNYLKTSQNDILVAWGAGFHITAKCLLEYDLKNHKLFTYTKCNKNNSPKHFANPVYNKPESADKGLYSYNFNHKSKLK